MSITVTEPGVYDIPEDAYHADPIPDGSLSQSGAKKLLADGGPALFHYEREHPPEPSKEMELGTAAHKLVLGVGQELHEIKADNWRGKKANDDADDARAAGKLPLLTKELATVKAMAAALREHRLASALLHPERGRPEMSAFWQDTTYGIWRRLRWDWMPEPTPTRRVVIPDYKTCADASRNGFAKAVANYGYDLQADWYTAGYVAMFASLISEPPAFTYIAQEKKPPYRVAVYQLHMNDLRAARADNERAMEIYRDCTEAGAWPGYSTEIEVLELPRWHTREIL